jgi:hypothetical protein
MHRTRAGLPTFPENDNGWVHGRSCLVTLFEVGITIIWLLPTNRSLDTQNAIFT